MVTRILDHEEEVSRLIAPILAAVPSQGMVSKNIRSGNRLGGISGTVESLQLGVIILQVQDQLLLAQTRARDVLNLTRDSQVRVVTNTQNLLVELLGEDIRNLQTLGGNPTPKTIVVVQAMIILPAPRPNVCVVGEPIRAAIVEDTLFGKVLPVSSVALCMILGCIEHAALLHQELLNLGIVKSRIMNLK